MVDRTLDQVAALWEDYYRTLSPTVSLQRGGSQLQVQPQGQAAFKIRLSTSTANSSSVRLR